MKLKLVAYVLWLIALVLPSGAASAGEMWDYKKELLPQLLDKIPEILKSQDPKTGRFGQGVFIVTDQNVIYPLATAWSINDPPNPHFHSPQLLQAIIAGGDALIAEQKPSGKWIFRKKDNSTWGDIYMPWTYSRWLRAFALIKDAMPTDRRAKWETALKLGYQGIAREELSKPVANIPCHHAMGLYLAGKVFDRPDWSRQATAYEHKVVDFQDPAGFWTEHSGPVVQYGAVYLDALGAYYGLSNDPYVLPALRRAALFHIAMTYPDGSAVETVDERNVYDSSIFTPNCGFSFCPEGRGYMKRQFELKARKSKTIVGADLAASFLLYGRNGEVFAPPDPDRAPAVLTADHNAMTRRAGPWFTCLSAYHAPVSTSRWIQDRQNLLSLFHDKTGLILGGGNTKLQPLWSTFTVGDVNLLFHKPGDENPNFIPPAGLVHVPTNASLDSDSTRLILEYSSVKCQLSVDLTDPHRARVVYATSGAGPDAIAAHVTFLPHLGGAWSTASGKSGTISGESFTLGPGESGDWFAHHGWRVHLPAQAIVQWPVLPHNQYVKDGHAEPKDGRIVVTLPFTKDLLRQEITVEVP